MIVSGCASKSPSKSEQGEQLIIDQLGREVYYPTEVNRVATLFAITGHTAVMLGAGEKIVAVNNGLKRDVLITELCPTILDAAMPKSAGSINIEELLTADPDIVFVEYDVAQNEREMEKLDQFNIPYFAVKFNTIAEQQEMILKIGEILNKQVRAQAFVDRYNSILEEVIERTEQIETEKIRVYHSVNEAYRTDPAVSIPTEWIQISGGRNVSAEDELEFLDNRYFASMEQILLWNPEVVLVNEEGVDTYILENDKWQSIAAIKNNQVYQLPTGISRWGHPNSLEIPLAALWTASKLYPEMFLDLDINQIIKDFYMDFFEYEIGDELLAHMLSGGEMRLEK
jgi:iron complex transport system substrate-binding protein